LNPAPKTTIAICYDFDGTLSPKNMQEYDFFSDLGTKARPFWDEVKAVQKANHADQILAYMMLMVEKAKARIGSDKTTKAAFFKFGKSVKLFPGVEDWFGAVDQYGAQRGIGVEHYIVSSGIREIIEGTSIAGRFKKIYACSFVYDGENGPAKWPAVAVNYTTKTQFLFRICKGIEDDTDDTRINAHVPEKDLRIPFSRMVYIGDGATDIPCMKLIKDKGGYAIAVYSRKDAAKRAGAEQLLADKRVNFVSPADYRAGSRMSALVRLVIDEMAARFAHEETKAALGEMTGKQAKT
jgi:2-hydroxy-3-keto-5-methylthiopentenyl-1-phosphate phosphatase